MSSAGVGLGLAMASVPVALWVFLLALLGKLHRRRRLPAGALRTVLVTGAAGNFYPVATAAGVRLPWWVLVTCLAVAIAVGYGYMLGQMRRHRAVVNGPWPEAPSVTRRRADLGVINARYRAAVARLDSNMTTSDRVGVDAPAHDETETR